LARSADKNEVSVEPHRFLSGQRACWARSADKNGRLSGRRCGLAQWFVPIGRPRPWNWSLMSFKVNDRVVYPHHGAAIIKKKVKRELAGETKEYFVLEMVHGDLTLSVPVDKAEEVGMRPPISKSDVDDLFRLIAKRDVREPANWSRRFKNHQEKMKSGDVYQVAEVVRNLALREKGKGLSTAEKSMLERARGILVSELSFALNVTEDDALVKLEKGLE
jgi:CarD family transcriptional regulator